MNIGVFSEFQSVVGVKSPVNYGDSSVSKQNKQLTTPNGPETHSSEKKEYSKKDKIISTIKKTAPIALPIIAIPVTALITYKIAGKNTNLLKNEINGLKDELSKLKELQKIQSESLVTGIEEHVKTSRKADAQIWSAILAIAGLGGTYKAGKLSGEDKAQISARAGDRINNVNNTANGAMSSAQQALAKNGEGLNRKYTVNYSGIPLLKAGNSLNRNENKYANAIESIKTAASDRLFNPPKVGPITNPNPALWSITSEFAPVKEGGLGSVPVELQNNITKLGIKSPAFIPMYQENGIASFREENGKYIYKYKNKEFDLKKAASFVIDTYRGGKSSSQEIEVYIHTEKDDNGNDKQLVFIKNNDYFDGTIYQAGIKTEEPEKFAVFSKAVYELAKAKFDLNSVKDLKINKELFDSIPTPDGLIVNDWQASPVAAMARYKAPLENAYGKLSDNASKALKDMRIITIGHNAMYQGSTQCNNDDVQRRESTSNILNTLFDEFAYDVTNNAKSGAFKSNPDDFGLRNLDNVVMLNQNDESQSHTNFLNMGICLSDYFCPVSENYAKELISDEHPELAGELRWALNQKTKAGSVVGIINGNDFKNLSIQAKLNNIKSMTGLEFDAYKKTDDTNHIISARRNNKIKFYNDFIIPYSKVNDKTNNTDEVNKIRSLTPKLELYSGKNGTNLPNLSDKELANTPIITSLGRLVSQKGIGVMTDAVEMLMNNWEKDFPGKPKPIFYFAGQDAENGTQRKYIEELKDTKLSKEDSNRVIFAHGFAPMAAMTAGSDFFLLPSIFEPCGLTQGESFALATPVIGSAVGGIVDTVNRNGKTNGVLTDKNKPLTPEGFYKAMKEGLNIYFNEPEKYQSMVKDSLNEDFSWIQPGKKGPIYDYLDLIGLNRDVLPDAA